MQRLQEDRREMDHLGDSGGSTKQLEGYWDDLMKTLVMEITGWEKVGEYLRTCVAGPREISMAKHRQQWCARRAHSLYRRLEMMC